MLRYSRSFQFFLLTFKVDVFKIYPQKIIRYFYKQIACPIVFSLTLSYYLKCQKNRFALNYKLTSVNTNLKLINMSYLLFNQTHCILGLIDHYSSNNEEESNENTTNFEQFKRKEIPVKPSMCLWSFLSKQEIIQIKETKEKRLTLKLIGTYFYIFCK